MKKRKKRQEGAGFGGLMRLVARRKREKKEPTGKNRLFFSLPNRWEGGAGFVVSDRQAAGAANARRR